MGTRWARRLLTDPAVLPSATTVRFAVLVLLVVATTGSIYGYLGEVVRPHVEQDVRACLTVADAPGALRGSLVSGSAALACTAGYAPTLSVWSVVGVGLLLALCVACYGLLPWWRIRITRGWLPFYRSAGTRRWRLAQPWWAPPWRPQRMHPLEPADGLQRDVAARISELAARIGLTEPPRVLLNKYVPDTNARAFGHRRHGYVQVNLGLLLLLRVDRSGFDAIVLHELAHLRNRDTRPSHLTILIWRVFVAVALLPYLVALLDPGLVAYPFDPGHGWFGFVAPDPHAVAAVGVLIALVFLSYRAVLRVRETHADATAATVDAEALTRLIEGQLAHGERRTPEFLDDHPKLRRRLADLAEPRRLAAPDLLAAFAVGLGVEVILVNLLYATWMAVLSQLVRGVGITTLAGAISEQPIRWTLLIYGPATLLALVVLVRFAQLAAWRTRLATPDGSLRPATLRMALAMALGLVLGDPVSLLYADAGIWGYDDGGKARVLIDVAASAFIVVVIIFVIFRLAEESANVAIPAAGSVRRVGNRVATLLVVGAFAPFFVWIIAHNSLVISEVREPGVPAPLRNWFGNNFMLPVYGPVVFLATLPAVALVFGAVIAALTASRRVPASADWLPAELHDAIDVLHASRTDPPARMASRAGLVATMVAMGVGLAVVLVTRAAFTQVELYQASGSGVMALIRVWLMWGAVVTSTTVSLVVARRHATTSMSAALLATFVGTTCFVVVIPWLSFYCICGPRTVACVRLNPSLFLTVASTPAILTPIYGLIVTALFVAIFSAIPRFRRRHSTPRAPGATVSVTTKAWTVVVFTTTVVVSVAASVLLVLEGSLR
jgi:Zn-dependent protease with chaperone function